MQTNHKTNDAGARRKKSIEIAHKVCAHILAPGQTVELTLPSCPRTRHLTAGADFSFDVRDVYAGKSKRAVAGNRTALLTARIPLAVALHNPSPDRSQAATIGHIRAARGAEAGTPRLAAFCPETIIRMDHEHHREIRIGLRELGVTEHEISGGVDFGVVYPDEYILPAYWSPEGDADVRPYAYIVNHAEASGAREKMRANARIVGKARRGEAVELKTLPLGEVVKVDLGAGLIQIEVDEAYRIFGLWAEGKPRAFVNFRTRWGMITLSMGEFVADIMVRQRVDDERNKPRMAMAFEQAAAKATPQPEAVKTAPQPEAVKTAPQPEAVKTAPQPEETRPVQPPDEVIVQQQIQSLAPSKAVVQDTAATPKDPAEEAVVNAVMELLGDFTAPAIDLAGGVKVVEGGSPLTREQAYILTSRSGELEFTEENSTFLMLLVEASNEATCPA